MQVLKIYPGNINLRYLDEAVEILKDGGVIVFPTDTNYAIGCSCLIAPAIEKVCSIKGINNAKQPLSIVCSDISQASEYVRIDNTAYRILRANLPGPFTFLLPATTRLPKNMRGRKTVGVRVPGCDISRALADRLGNPLMCSSVGMVEGEEAEAGNARSIAMNLEGKINLVIDGGFREPINSTVVDLQDPASPEIEREGVGQLNF